MRLALAALLVVLIVSLLLPSGGRAADEAPPVRVTNFPTLFKIQGQVEVLTPVPHSTFIRMKEVTVPPVEPTETGRLIDGGTIDATGFTTAVLSLSGRASGRALRSGTVGAYLVPDEEAIVKAYEEDALMQFPIEINAPLQTSTYRQTAMQQSKADLGFPRYRVRLYNTTDRTVTVNLYAYLTQ